MSFGEQLIAWRRELHQNPELSGQEVETTARCAGGCQPRASRRCLTTCRPVWWRRSGPVTN